ncbi:RagB/SusD family nutrient uptake outer membrane protein [Parabacteroides sp. BX2]|jgi:starch-binding outer membrane protein, SusD/RagB family|uniref:RagB/SusD family nutrient uptake outer membrane protein n=1 Tax=Parabacteroides segnis TaxID=2763058 RepID=A0ABR7E0W8_9BACT|nr:MULTISPECIES: RagB/SusD family nutrient uptake outer membrane protein [Parabacteroides]MBC5642784.1 RagB/SusD family nutrient uptake outer membrane protein [Parabacteroides segnis]MCM0713812.1 RagB/SusD family nutrient uptake outer membrane protein [Parabacteroides sp. TA-V-105]
MKNIVKTSLFAVVVMMSTSCADFLDPYPYGRLSEEDFWERQDAVQGLVGQCYDYMQRNYNHNNGFFLDGATDDAVVTSSTHAMAKLATGALTPSKDPFEAYWIEDYKGIALVNKFLKDQHGFNTRFMVDAHFNDLVRYRLQGEAFGLRAWFQWDLLRRYGGIGIKSGELLGFPIITEPVNVFEDDVNLARDTYAACVKQIESDCDSAYAYLPIAHRDFLVENAGDLVYAGSRYWGRLDGITMTALKSQMYLTYASPLFNPENDMTRWEKAAIYAKQVIDFKLNVDNVKNGFNPVNRVDWTDPNFPGIVYGSRYDNNNDAMERALYPGGFQGNGALGATQDLVDAFPMKNGYPKDHPEGAKLYDPKNPYANRDPRFYSVIFYNNSKANRDNNETKPMYTFECWENQDALGKDAAGNKATSRTNYHIKKYIYMGLNWSDATVKKMPHSRFYIRWAHMVLNFAEAANEIGGPNHTIDGLSAKEAMKYLRTRKTYDGKELYTDDDPYLDEVATMGKDQFRKFIQNERRLETCFEGMRFYDLRRWSKDGSIEMLNQPVYKAKILKNAENTFDYDKDVVENRIYTSPYLPLPYDDILRMDKLEQNKGWDNWQ